MGEEGLEQGSQEPEGEKEERRKDNHLLLSSLSYNIHTVQNLSIQYDKF